ncbi:helix-turn-helix transcriptional regulator [Pseudooceanicola algae]|uniref:HTH-type transcriptional regulator MalT n=1 Tax=Pseudooceanicola algae TaxID=1537215 RepID=A0A418SHK7_9RHOB|nr:LuxR C-terminal-related transcriptional regulator [Pseudooceanicola algae]QPM90538.1 HTH-type transcriptional regulator MalT [Pseudooceanicola algae]
MTSPPALLRPLGRPLLVDRILRAAPGSTVFLRAPAGAGKSVLMHQAAERAGVTVCDLHHPRLSDVQDGWLFWDVPGSARTARLSAQVAETVEHLVIAHRPAQKITGLARRILHGGSGTVDADALGLSAAEIGTRLPAAVTRRLCREYAGWPAFLPLAAMRAPTAGPTPDTDTDLATSYVSETFLAQLSPGPTTRLSLWLEAPEPDPRQDPAQDWCDALPPFVLAAPDPQSDLFAALRRAVAARLEGFTNSGAVTEVARALEAAQRPLAAMELLLDHGHESHAAQVLERSRGLELIYDTNLEGFSHAVLRFSQEIIATNETVLFAITRTLMKQGEFQRVRHLVVKHLGSDYLDPLKVLSRGARFSFAARRFRLNMMISEDMMPSDAMMQRLGEFMADYPVGDEQKWAAFYNALLEFEVRRRNFRAAEAAAARALIYFRKMGGHPLLEFFIHLHLAVLHLTNGDARLARPAARDARSGLERVTHPVAQEYRMLRLIEAALAYEEGQPQRLVTFLQDEFNDFARAEIWPSLFHFAIRYASQVVMDQYPASIRPGFLDGLWLHVAERMNLLPTIQIRTATAYQNEGRISEAEVTLQALGTARNTPAEEMTPDGLYRLADRDDIGLAMARLRCSVQHPAPGPLVDRQIDALESNPKITLREAIALKIWRAHLARKRRDTAAARTHLQAAFTSASRLGCFGVLSEQRIFLAPLLREARIRNHLETRPDIRATLTIYTGSISSPNAKARAGGLTEREAQLLHLIAGGHPNKRIAQMLHIAEPTVKFHLSRLYAKLGASKRAEAIKTAHALGWL